MPTSSDIRWRKPGDYFPPKKINTWLLDQGSLTQKLIQRSNGHFRVELIRCEIDRPQLSEARLLELPQGQWAAIREVILYGRDEPWVYARSIIPLSTLKGPLKHLYTLGNRPLGALLFADPKVQRGKLQIASILPDYLPARLQAVSSNWGRRSVFFLKRKPLLVSEVFLEKFWQADSN